MLSQYKLLSQLKYELRVDFLSGRTKFQIWSHIIIEHFEIRTENVIESHNLAPTQLFEILQADIVLASEAALPVGPRKSHVDLLETAPLRDELDVLPECLHLPDHIVLELAEVTVEPVGHPVVIVF